MINIDDGRFWLEVALGQTHPLKIGAVHADYVAESALRGIDRHIGNFVRFPQILHARRNRPFIEHTVFLAQT
ncbi:hypothetical protein D3C73_1527220 [compost metagenome]